MDKEAAKNSQPAFDIEQLKELIKRRQDLVVNPKDVPQPELLIAMHNAWPRSFREHFTFAEFKVLSPVNAKYPTKGTLTISWVPQDLLFDPLSISAYLKSFETVQMFHYEVPALVAYTLFELGRPATIHVEGVFSVDGRLEIKVESYLPTNR